MVTSRTPKRDWAASIVAANWRIRKRLPRITEYAIKYGFIEQVKNG